MKATPVRWGMLSTANIARISFLPGLRAAGGAAYAVASRDLERAQQFAAEQGIEHAIEGYTDLLADERVDAVYVPLPNSLHAEWCIAALRAGKAVLCEKPLCTTAEETERVLEVARESRWPLWEAFVFPFREQTERVQDLMASDEVGELREVQAGFYFLIRDRNNIRLRPELGGGALYDIGCYPIRLSRLLFDGEAGSGMAVARWAPEGVDEETQGILTFSGERRLLLSCGMTRPFDRYTRLIGTKGEIRLTDPYHPAPTDTLEVRVPGRVVVENETETEPSFTKAIRHIQAVLRGEEEPRHTAVEEAMGNARAIDLLYASARSGRQERI